MKRIGKWLLAALGLVLLLLVIVIVVATFVIDPNDYRARVETLVQQHTGRELRIEGDVELTFFPWLGVELGAMELGNAPEFGPEPFAQLDKAVVRVGLLPLLRGEVQADTVVVHGLNMRLARAADGRTNWDDLTGEPAEAPAEEEAPPGRALAGLAIGGLDVREAHIDWNDSAAGQRVRLEGLNLRSGRIAPGEAFPLSLETRFSSSAPQLVGGLDLQAEVTADPEAERYRISDLRAQTTASGEPLPAGGLEAVLALAGLEADLGKETAAVQGLRLESGGMAVEANAQARKLLTEPTVEGQLASNEFVPRQVMGQLGLPAPETTDADALSKARMQAAFSATPTAATLSDIDVHLDDSRLEGTVALTDFTAPGVRFELALDALDLDRYLPPATEEEAHEEAPAAETPSSRGPAGTPGVAAAAGAGELPLEPLRTLDLDGTLDIGRLTAMGLASREIHVTARAEGGRVRLHPLSARLYEGQYTGDVGVDVTGAVPKLSMDESLSGVQLGPLLDDLQGEGMLSGTADLAAKLTAEGTEPEAVRKTLNGSAQFSISDGALKGVNIAQMIREAWARYRGESVPEEAGPRETDFTALSGSVTVDNGLVENRDLEASSPLLRVNGRGTVNLVTEAIDYLADIVLVQSLEGQSGQSLEELKGLTLPLQIKGTLSEPGFQLDVDRVLREKGKELLEEKEAEVKQRLEQEKREQSEELKKELEGEVQDRLKKLFD